MKLCNIPKAKALQHPIAGNVYFHKLTTRLYFASTSEGIVTLSNMETGRIWHAKGGFGKAEEFFRDVTHLVSLDTSELDVDKL